MQGYGGSTTLPFNKYFLPIFANRRLNGNLGVLVNPRGNEDWGKHNYNEHNLPVTTNADAGQHMAD